MEIELVGAVKTTEKEVRVRVMWTGVGWAWGNVGEGRTKLNIVRRES